MKFISDNGSWWILGAAILLYPLTMVVVYKTSHDNVIQRAEKDIETMLLQHKGVHQYVQRLAHPELYDLKDQNAIPDELYTPVLFSSSYMVRNMHDFYNEERTKAGLPELYYKMAATSPRNPINQASEFETSLIELFNRDDSPAHYQEVLKIDEQKYLYVAVPFLRNEERCLKCHGNIEDAPLQLQERYPDAGGYNESVGYIRAIESLRAPLTGELTPTHTALFSAGIIGAAIIGLLLLNQRLGRTVKKRTQVIEQQARAIKDREQNLRITLNSIGDAVIAVDPQGFITNINPVAALLTGWSPDEAKGQPLERVFTVIDANTRTEHPNPADLVLQTGEAVTLPDQTLLIAKDGTERLIADSGAPILDDSGACAGVVLVFRDVTEKSVLEKKLHQAQKMDAIGQLAGGIAHDFNNMLGGIMGATELLQCERPHSETEKTFLNLILNTSRRAADLTRQLLAFSRKSNMHPTPVDMHDVIQETMALLSHTLDKKIKIETNLNATASTVTGDVSQLQNVLLNLGINAGDAMPEGGTLTYTTRLSELDETYCNSSSAELEPGVYIIIQVKDDGCGMSPETVERVFEPFFTTKTMHKGTGLGLAAAFGTIQQHHGSITVYSEEHKGSVFNIALPLTKTGTTARPQQPAPIQGSGTILVVDDEETIRKTTEAILTHLGYDVLTANNGKDALKVFAENKHTIDLVLLDMIMPEMNGTECMKKLTELAPDLPIVLSSGFTNDADIDTLKQQGLTDFIQKPYQTLELSLAIAHALRHNHPA
jgi:PAS domain S-box-containing protein